MGSSDLGQVVTEGQPIVTEIAGALSAIAKILGAIGVLASFS